MRTHADACAVNTQGIAALTQISFVAPNMVTMSAVSSSAVEALDPKFAKAKPSGLGFMPLETAVLFRTGVVTAEEVPPLPQPEIVTTTTVKRDAIVKRLLTINQ